MAELQPLPPILTAHLFPKIERLLIELLQSLTFSEWEKQTIAPGWTVKDVASHLLDTQLRRLSTGRDGYFSEVPSIKSNDDLLAFVNRLNRDGVATHRRLSPSVIISLLEVTSRQFVEYCQSLDPFAQARIGVSWAGEERSLNWFDIAREFTERWHHQQQIRLAVNRPGIMTRELYCPVLDCFMRALPFTYRDVRADDESLLQFNVSGECGGSWYLYRDKDSWRLVTHPAGIRTCNVTIPEDIAWRVFTKGIDRESAAAQTHVEGDSNVGLRILGMKSIVG